ncbi:MAG: DASS family sodium-coupled anion symporter [Phycisphaeraceae bacterium]|nr:DASS family sodium-coupled anion symporter [Phycisphaeraceae bacterium]
MAAAAGCAAGAYWLLPSEVGELGRRATTIFVVAAFFWAGRVIPLYATSLGVVVVSVLLLAEDGGLAGEGGIAAQAFLDPFASNIMMLFFGGLVLSAALSHHGVDEVIARRVFQPLAARPLLLVYAVMGTTALFSMWMSNTATTAMMLAVIGARSGKSEREGQAGIPLVLAVAMGANIGGLGTPIGTPPNAIAMGALQDAGYDMTFFRWVIMAMPLVVIMLAIAGLLLFWMYRPGTGALPDRKESKGKLDRKARATLAILGLAILLWMTSGLHGVADGVVALIVVLMLVVTGLVGRDEIKSIQWPVLILMWGGLALGVALSRTELMRVTESIRFDEAPAILVVAGLMITAMLLSTFISNTATAAMLVPIVLGLSVADQGKMVILVALACSFAMAMPVSTPPNALAYGTDRVPIRELAKVGGLLAALALVLVLLGYRIVLPVALPFVP